VPLAGTVTPKNRDDPELKGVYSLAYSLEEVMPPRKRDSGGSNFDSSRSFAIKPKIELPFDVAFNHNHMLTLFRDNEHELVEHYFSKNVRCTLPMGKLGVQTAKGPREVVALLAGTILGPNQIMKNVKPMPPTEKIIESRTVVTRDLLPPAKMDLHDIEDAMHHEGHEDSDSEAEEEYEEIVEESLIASLNDDVSVVTGAANPNEPGEGELLPPPMSEEEKLLRKEFMKVAKNEVLMIRDLKLKELACAEEVRTIHLPAHKAPEITEFAKVNDELVHNRKYGGSELHLQVSRRSPYLNCHSFHILLF